MLIAGRNGMAVKFPVTAKNYVQDGLIHMYDGLENTGYGTHDSTTATWRDLAGSGGGMDLSCTNVSWGDDHASFSGNGYAINNSQWVIADGKTLECCYMTSSPGPFELVNVSVSDNKTAGYYRLVVRMTNNNNNPLVYFANGRNYSAYTRYRQGDASSGATISVRADKNAIVDAFFNASAMTAYGADYNIDGSQGICIGGANATTRLYTGRVYCVRLYSRKLSTEELQANDAVDKIRFNLP